MGISFTDKINALKDLTVIAFIPVFRDLTDSKV